MSRGGGGRGGAFPETSAITPEPGEFVAVLERCGDNLELCFLNACASVAIARRIVHDLPNVKVLCSVDKLQNSRFLDESIALVEFSRHSRRARVETVAYAHIEVGLKI